MLLVFSFVLYINFNFAVNTFCTICIILYMCVYSFFEYTQVIIIEHMPAAIACMYNYNCIYIIQTVQKLNWLS